MKKGPSLFRKQTQEKFISPKKDIRIEMKNCQLKETHFQAEGKGSSRLWGKALDLLLFASLPHTFFTILPLQGKFRKQIVEHKNTNVHFMEKERDASPGSEKDLELLKSKQHYCPLTYFVFQRFPGHMIARGWLLFTYFERDWNIFNICTSLWLRMGDCPFTYFVFGAN